ncbi:hypothetical protein DPMN_034018 [Dreissena polymorpha]|uniref:Uncharacterized protein n=1 Tax=Dreissena polymorpha TaxID=45954 RepID=A0A9D4M6U0_DREPO|nr:hypothetical protein DPMN_034018 [Dreissena polymorpha]
MLLNIKEPLLKPKLSSLFGKHVELQMAPNGIVDKSSLQRVGVKERVVFVKQLLTLL